MHGILSKVGDRVKERWKPQGFVNMERQMQSENMTKVERGREGGVGEASFLQEDDCSRSSRLSIDDTSLDLPKISKCIAREVG